MNGRVVQFGSGFWVPVFEEPYAIVGRFLDEDAGYCLESCDCYLKTALDVAAGNDTPSEMQGNGSIVRIMHDWVLIRHIFNETLEPAVISMDAFVSVLRYWKSIVAPWASVPWDKRSPPTDPPEFSYDNPTPSPPLSADVALREFKSALAEVQESRRRAREEGGDIEIIRGHHRDHLR